MIKIAKIKNAAVNPILSKNWKRPASKILQNGILEDDSNRLGSH